jgi:molybdenum cofactor cytidylyltransferase
MIFAVVPAAGRSTRMGRPKVLLPLGGRTVIERVIDTLELAGIDRILVVTSPELPEVAAVVRNAGAHAVELTAPTEHMRETVQHGLDWIEAHWSPQPSDAFLLVPADHPTLDVTAIAVLLVAKMQHSQFSIFIPTYGGKRGHPALVGWQHVAGIRQSAPSEGLNSYFRRHVDETLEVAVTSASVLLDLDTPEEYERLRREFGEA